MNKNAIKNFAVTARVTLIQAVTQKAFEYEITADGKNDPSQDSVNGQTLTAAERSQRAQLIERIRANGFVQTMEEAAYTWFNRFIALRFMEVNNYLPSHVRIFSDENGEFKPEVLTDAVNLEIDGLDKALVLELLENQENERLYQYIIITQCNALHEGLPEMFEHIGVWTELLFPKNLLREDSVIAHMVEDIPEADWQDQVQIIGWLYQYYNTEPKDKVFANLKKNVKISAADIPAATQLFTPDWIVRYMVENSLGRLWAEGHGKPEHADWKYYLEEAEQEDTVRAELKQLREAYREIQPEQIRIIDPCMGSGHILVYAFDVLMDIYTACGWSERDAAVSILRNNLYGLDIDRRAYQLAYFAVMMKARQYNRRILRGENQPNLANFADVMGVNTSMLSGSLRQFVEQFQFADTYGSLMTVTAPAGLDEMVAAFHPTIGLDEVQLKAMEKLYKILSQKYDVVCTNPPYMGSSGMNAVLSDYVKKNFPDSKSDLSTCFMERCGQLTSQNGYYTMINIPVWMFLSSFEKLRKKIEVGNTYVNMVHFGRGIFGSDFGTTSFVISKRHINAYTGVYRRLFEKQGAVDSVDQKEKWFFEGMGYYTAKQENFSKIPGSPVAYWVSENFVRVFENPKIGELASSKQGLATGCNDIFIRQWYEVKIDNIKFDAHSIAEAVKSRKKWFPYNKGGEFRKWYGNNDFVVNWENDGYLIRNFKNEQGKLRSRPQNIQFYFKKSISWSLVSSGCAAFRYKPYGYIFDIAGMSVFSNNNLYYLLALCNSNFAMQVLKVVAPTINYQCGDIANIPVLFPDQYLNPNLKSNIEKITEENIEECKCDWDSFEISWDFEKHPLIDNIVYFDNKNCALIADAFYQWEQITNTRFIFLKSNEEELNRIFIDIYGLQDELTPEVEDRDVTVRRADLQREIRSLLSYAVGCLFGRYSLDVDGLCYAGGEWDAGKYKTIIPVKDNVLPICDDDYLESDLTGKIVDFVKTVYGEDTLEENLKFIADALGTKGATPREVIRNYLLTGFYADHCRIYQKRPIYWLFSSGKKHGFKALVYMHRWEKTTVATVRTDYVHELQERYRTQLSMLGEQLEQAAPSERVKLKKRQEKLTAQLDEINAYEEKVHHLADRMIDIDLDDGVKVNYAKFAEILEKIK